MLKASNHAMSRRFVMHRPDHSGFTVIEMMITLSVLAIVLTLVVPAFGRLVMQQRVTATTNHVVAQLQFARSEAIRRNAPVAACPSSDGLSCTGGNRWEAGWIVYLDEDKSGQPTQTDDVLRVIQAVPEQTMHSGGRKRARFKGSGAAYGSNLTIRVCARDNPQAAR